MSQFRSTVAMLTGALLAVGAMAGCTDEGNKEAFCTRVERTPLLVDVVGELESSDPAGSQARLQQAVREFKVLETDAPGEIKADMARLRQGVELVLEAVEDHPDDLPGARQAILAQEDQLAGLASAGEHVATYVATECDLDLVPGSPDTNTDGSTGSDSSTSTTEG